MPYDERQILRPLMPVVPRDSIAASRPLGRHASGRPASSVRDGAVQAPAAFMASSRVA